MKQLVSLDMSKSVIFTLLSLGSQLLTLNLSGMRLKRCIPLYDLAGKP